MNQKVFCPECREMVEYTVKPERINVNIGDSNKSFAYDGYEAYCCKCKNSIFVASVCDDNLEIFRKEYEKNRKIL